MKLPRRYKTHIDTSYRDGLSRPTGDCSALHSPRVDPAISPAAAESPPWLREIAGRVLQALGVATPTFS